MSIEKFEKSYLKKKIARNRAEEEKIFIAIETETETETRTEILSLVIVRKI